MILSGHQPEYLPYIGFFYKMAKADKFILVDHVQFVKKSWQNRNRIRTTQSADGWTWLTVPVITHDARFQKINEVEIDNSIPWGKKHWKAISINYKKAPFFNMYGDFFEKLYSKKWQKLADLNENIIYYLKEELRIETPIIKSSDFDFKKPKTDLLIEMCEKVGADTYLSGLGGKNYVKEEDFKKNNLKHIFSDFNHPVYFQGFEPFISNLSVIDLLFNCGPKSLDIILGKNENNSFM